MGLLIYGANGYTGRIMVEDAHTFGLKPIIGGRSKEAIKELADKKGLDYLIFDLNNAAETEKALQNVDVGRGRRTSNDKSIRYDLWMGVSSHHERRCTRQKESVRFGKLF